MSDVNEVQQPAQEEKKDYRIPGEHVAQAQLELARLIKHIARSLNYKIENLTSSDFKRAQTAQHQLAEQLLIFAIRLIDGLEKSSAPLSSEALKARLDNIYDGGDVDPDGEETENFYRGLLAEPVKHCASVQECQISLSLYGVFTELIQGANAQAGSPAATASRHSNGIASAPTTPYASGRFGAAAGQPSQHTGFSFLKDDDFSGVDVLGKAPALEGVVRGWYKQKKAQEAQAQENKISYCFYNARLANNPLNAPLNSSSPPEAVLYNGVDPLLTQLKEVAKTRALDKRLAILECAYNVIETPNDFKQLNTFYQLYEAEQNEALRHAMRILLYSHYQYSKTLLNTAVDTQQIKPLKKAGRRVLKDIEKDEPQEQLFTENHLVYAQLMQHAANVVECPTLSNVNARGTIDKLNDFYKAKVESNEKSTGKTKTQKTKQPFNTISVGAIVGGAVLGLVGVALAIVGVALAVPSFGASLGLSAVGVVAAKAGFGIAGAGVVAGAGSARMMYSGSKKSRDNNSVQSLIAMTRKHVDSAPQAKSKQTAAPTPP